jgi:SOS-response transcriptional repressor LexA
MTMDEYDEARRRASLERLEAASDPLIDVIGFVESLRPTSRAYDDERFVTWLAHEGRARRVGEFPGTREVARLTRRICAAALAERSRVHLADQPPEMVAVRAGWTVSSAIVELAKRRQAAVVDLAIAAGSGRDLWDVECEAAVALPSSLPRGEYVALTVLGDSMEPLLHSGDLVLVRRSAELKPGAIVVMHDSDAGYVVKKVGSVQTRTVELLSLNPSYARRHVRRTRSSVLGTVLLRWCQHEVA